VSDRRPKRMDGGLPFSRQKKKETRKNEEKENGPRHNDVGVGAPWNGQARLVAGFRLMQVSGARPCRPPRLMASGWQCRREG